MYVYMYDTDIHTYVYIYISIETRFSKVSAFLCCLYETSQKDNTAIRSDIVIRSDFRLFCCLRTLFLFFISRLLYFMADMPITI